MAVECARRNVKRCVPSICEWVSIFVREYLLEWIVDPNGWVGGDIRS